MYKLGLKTGLKDVFTFLLQNPSDKSGTRHKKSRDKSVLVRRYRLKIVMFSFQNSHQLSQLEAGSKIVYNPP
ncbi:hypothetical protein AYI70_g2263 [Smittium culicis]|uniref:Uncharacterized protein n=1 Tax=Smittium culicis TaxID=133412 RepID=A0A1R1Y917_9FUNG|nr:hypothetical protein AYI70_g2263 [Smittium culicis]